jgi:predicted Zn-dependent protease with MMP-like domain
MTTRAHRKRGFSGGKRFFEKLVKEAVGLLPRELRLRLENVAFIVEDESPPRPEEWEDDGQELLGLYHGISQRDRGFWYGNVLPDRIIIYRRPLERISASSQELRENVRLTVFHEVGHYFGFDEEELQRFEKGDF